LQEALLNYTEWQTKSFKGKSAKEISKEAMEFVKKRKKKNKITNLLSEMMVYHFHLVISLPVKNIVLMN
jgi:hypothetical protein